MSSINIALNKPIHSYSSHYGYVYTADKINNGNYYFADPYVWVSAEYQVSNQWIIIDLEENRILDSVRLYSSYYSDTPDMAVKDFSIALSTTGTDPEDFSVVASGSLALPSGEDPPPNHNEVFDFPLPARYIKINFLNNHGDDRYLLAGELEAYTTFDGYVDVIYSSTHILKEVISSSSSILKEFSYFTDSDSSIVKEFVDSTESNSSIIKEVLFTISSYLSTIKEFLFTIESNSLLLFAGSKFIDSYASIYKEYEVTLESDSSVSKYNIISYSFIIKETINSNILIVYDIESIIYSNLYVVPGRGGEGSANPNFRKNRHIQFSDSRKHFEIF